ncbi:MAG: serine/threonine protein kinase [Planctomycetaceae bacterium]|nr:serine/threonine protein kinase [Planctomycetaceae bacterium]
MKQPEQLGPFRILQSLGRGGMGAVYQGLHVETGEPVAIKVLLERFDEETPEARLRFEAEIDALRMLRHPNIVRLNGYGQEGDLLYYVMELVCGASLHKELKKQRGFLWQDVTKIGYDVCLALKHGHDRGITHRDLKPANIMLDNSGMVKIADYGIAHCFGNHRLTGSNSVIGTIEFMSPEQAIAGPVGPKSDLYSLGAVLYALLCRKPPFGAKTLPEIVKKHLNEPLEDISRFRQDAPAELVRIIRHILERKPDDRPNNAFLVAKRFEELLESEFGSVDSVIVLPSKFDDTPSQTPPSDATRTAFLGTRHGEDESKGDSQSFQLQTGVPLEKNVVSQTNLQDGTDRHHAEEKEGEPLSQSCSIYHDLTSQTPVAGSFTEDVTRQTSAFDHVKENGRFELQQENSSNNMQPETKGVLESTSAFGQAPTVGSGRPDGIPHISKFTAIAEEELGYHFESGDSENRPFISVQVAVLSLCLVILGLWAWWMLQPPSADKLYDSITQHINPDRRPLRQSAILAAESSITKFLELYSQDDRAATVLRLQKEAELANMERYLDRLPGVGATDKKLLPVQRAYLEAISLINTKPDEAVRRLEAVITLYEIQRFSEVDESDDSQGIESQEPDLSNPISMTVEIARRQLETLRGDMTPIIEDQIEQLERVVERIESVEATDPDRAAAMRKAAGELYSDKPWAAGILAQLDRTR